MKPGQSPTQGVSSVALTFEVDENLPVEVAELLRQAGQDALTVGDQGLVGGPDLRLADLCCQEGRALVTLDLDFADVLTYPPDPSPGFLVIRGRRQDKPYVLNLVRRFIPLLDTEPLRDHLWIVEESRVRIRP
jgi:predicted nuclease of predicted toxin-antitoxin system